jgi:DNA-binding transcriptional regulator YdaS (Cro superfamily)
MSPQQVLEHFGTQAEIARALGCRQPSVAEWFAEGRVPEGRQYQIELATKGALKADKPAKRNGTKRASARA